VRYFEAMHMWLLLLQYELIPKFLSSHIHGLRKC
jgi:hypothetical protein